MDKTSSQDAMEPAMFPTRGAVVTDSAAPATWTTEMTETVLQNAFDLWFEPEIKRRQAAGILPTPFSLWAAQVLIEPDGPATIHFNDRLRDGFKIKIHYNTPKDISKGWQLD